MINGAIEISQLTGAGSLDGTEVIPADQAGNTVKLTSQQLANLVIAEINANPNILTGFATALSSKANVKSTQFFSNRQFISFNFSAYPGLGSLLNLSVYVVNEADPSYDPGVPSTWRFRPVTPDIYFTVDNLNTPIVYTADLGYVAAKGFYAIS